MKKPEKSGFEKMSALRGQSLTGKIVGAEEAFKVHESTQLAKIFRSRKAASEEPMRKRYVHLEPSTQNPRKILKKSQIM